MLTQSTLVTIFPWEKPWFVDRNCVQKIKMNLMSLKKRWTNCCVWTKKFHQNPSFFQTQNWLKWRYSVKRQWLLQRFENENVQIRQTFSSLLKSFFRITKMLQKATDFSFLCENWMIYFVQFNGTIHVLRNNHVAYFNFVEISGSRWLVKLQLNSDVKARHIYVFYYTPFKLHPKNIQFIEIFEFSIWSRPSWIYKVKFY